MALVPETRCNRATGEPLLLRYIGYDLFLQCLWLLLDRMNASKLAAVLQGRRE